MGGREINEGDDGENEACPERGIEVDHSSVHRQAIRLESLLEKILRKTNVSQELITVANSIVVGE